MDHVPEILFVDDNPGDSELVEEAFRQYEVAVRFRKVESGAKALAVLRQAARDGDPLPDLVLLDVNLPVMSGHEVLRQIRSDPALAGIEVVMLSSSERRDIEQSEQQEASYVIKPANWDEYLVLVRSFEQRLKKRREAEAVAAAAQTAGAAADGGGALLSPPPVLKGLEPEPDER